MAYSAIDPAASLSYADYVFVGMVEEHLGNIEEEGMSVKSKYKVTVIENIKGRLVEEITLYKWGGYKCDGKLLILGAVDPDKDFLPEVGNKYIFIAFGQEDSSLLVSVLGNKDYSEKEAELYRKVNDKNTKRERYISKYDVRYNN